MYNKQSSIKFYILDVFASGKYQGNQLAVFIDLDNELSTHQMQEMAKEINFAESAFITKQKENLRFTVRIFTTEYEVPFAGHPSLGTAYIISRFILTKAVSRIILELAYGDIEITIPEPTKLEDGLFFMRQPQPVFGDIFTVEKIADGLGIKTENIDASYPIQEISTGLPYIMIPLKNLEAMESLKLNDEKLKAFLIAEGRYLTNSETGLSTSLFFFTKYGYEGGNTYNSRMLLIENDKLIEDAATGSANGCLLAYLLQYVDEKIVTTVEQGFQMGRKSYIHLDGRLTDEHYEINIGGQSKLVSEGIWYA
jgi:trans-2,3-dihydro-3-hydroxyanthranilate isomerase